MKKLLLGVVLMAVLLPTGGCTAVRLASAAVDTYCGLPETARDVNRTAVGIAVSPNAIKIDCAN